MSAFECYDNETLCGGTPDDELTVLPAVQVSEPDAGAIAPWMPTPGVAAIIAGRWWMEDAHLAIDDEGRVTLLRFPTPYSDRDWEPIRVGWIEDAPYWPRHLGPEPKWFETEWFYLKDRWDDGKEEAR